jgi:hypothetical protein
MDRVNANEFGGTMTGLAWTETNERSRKALGSMMAQFTLVKNPELAGDAEVITAGRKPKGNDAVIDPPLAERAESSGG